MASRSPGADVVQMIHTCQSFSFAINQVQITSRPWKRPKGSLVCTAHSSIRGHFSAPLRACFSQSPDLVPMLLCQYHTGLALKSSQSKAH
eukprot:993657-Amphidinium_carterae.1